MTSRVNGDGEILPDEEEENPVWRPDRPVTDWEAYPDNVPELE